MSRWRVALAATALAVGSVPAWATAGYVAAGRCHETVAAAVAAYCQAYDAYPEWINATVAYTQGCQSIALGQENTDQGAGVGGRVVRMQFYRSQLTTGAAPLFNYWQANVIFPHCTVEDYYEHQASPVAASEPAASVPVGSASEATLVEVSETATVAGYSVVGLLLFFSLMHGFTVGRSST